MPYAHVNHTAIYYKDYSEGAYSGDGGGRDPDPGPPLLLLHGLGADHTIWQPQIEVFSGSNRVITPDLRGAGRSGSIRGWRHILATQATDMAGLLDKLGLEEAAVCGVDHGGVVAQRLALDYPARCRALIVVDAFSEQAKASEGLGLIAANTLLVPGYLLPGSWLAPGVRRHYARWPLARAYFEERVRKLRGLEALKVRLALNRVNTTPALRGLRCPALGIVGDASEADLVMMKRLVGAVPGAELEIIKDALRPSTLCQPETFNALLRDFLARVGWTKASAS